MQKIGSKHLKDIDQGIHLRALLNDFLASRKVNSYTLVESLKCVNSSEIFHHLESDLTHTDKQLLQALINRFLDPLTDRDTAIQNCVMNLLKVDDFRCSAPFGDKIKVTALKARSDINVQKWLVKCYMQIALLDVACERGSTVGEIDRRILRQYRSIFNKCFINKFLSIYSFKLPLFIPFICALIVAYAGQIPISNAESVYIAPTQIIGLNQFINNFGGGFLILLTSTMFYTSLFRNKLLFKAFSLRTIYGKCIKHIKEKLLTYALSFSLIASFFALAPQTLFYSNESIGYLISDGRYSEAVIQINNTDWHRDQKDYAKAQVLMAQKPDISKSEFDREFKVVTDKIVADYLHDTLPEWANEYVVSSILKERQITSNLKSFREVSMYLYLCIFLYFFAYLLAKNADQRVIQYKLDKSNEGSIKRMMY